MLDESAISSVNWAEVAQKSIAGGVEVDGLREDVEALRLSILPFTPRKPRPLGGCGSRLAPAACPLGIAPV